MTDSAIDSTAHSRPTARPRRALLIVAITAVTMAVAYGIAVRRGDLYRSEATILVVPQQISPAIVPIVAASSLDERLRTIRDQLMSRSRLERVIEELQLYPDLRRTAMMEDVVETMRRAIGITVGPDRTFRVSFTAAIARDAQKVAGKLANMFIEENVHTADQIAVNTAQFLEASSLDARRRLDECEASTRAHPGQAPLRSEQLTCQFLADTFVSLLGKLENAQLANNLQTRQLSDSFRVIDPARIPERPIGPGRPAMLLFGLVIGLALGVTAARIADLRGENREAAGSR